MKTAFLVLGFALLGIASCAAQLPDRTVFQEQTASVGASKPKYVEHNGSLRIFGRDAAGVYKGYTLGDGLSIVGGALTASGGGGLTNIASTVSGGTLTFAGTLTTGRTVTFRDLAGTVALTSDLSSYLTTSAAAASYQPLDADLTAIASLTTTSTGRSLLAASNAAAIQTISGTVIGTDVQAHDSDLDSIAALTTHSFGRDLLTKNNGGTVRTYIGAVGAVGPTFTNGITISGSPPALVFTNTGSGFSIAIEDTGTTATRILNFADADGYFAVTDQSTGRVNLTNGVVNTLPKVNAATGTFTESLIIAASDEATAVTTGTGKVTFRMPYAMTLTAVRLSVGTAPTGSTMVVDINEGGTTVLSTKLSVDATEKTSTTAATAAVISDSSLADDAEITIDFDQVGSTIAGAGVKVTLIGTR